ncbi:glycosyltransferase, partial [Streptomyces sp. HSW2009]|uniref:glycosyltransferase n=1 Tax=Streptomyces sp. HSW2009 TaxID=3142890 RepID=UPI0032EB64B6
ACTRRQRGGAARACAGPCGRGGRPAAGRGLAGVDLCHALAGGTAALPGLLAKRFFGTPLLVTEYRPGLRERYLTAAGGDPTGVGGPAGLAGAIEMAGPVGPGEGAVVAGDGAYGVAARALVAAFHRELAAEVYAQAALVTAGNAYTRRWQERCGADPARLRTVYPGVYPHCFDEVGERAGTGARTLLWVGPVEPERDLVALLHAFAEVHRAEPDVRLRIVDTGPATTPPDPAWTLAATPPDTAALHDGTPPLMPGPGALVRAAYGAAAAHESAYGYGPVPAGVFGPESGGLAYGATAYGAGWPAGAPGGARGNGGWVTAAGSGRWGAGRACGGAVAGGASGTGAGAGARDAWGGAGAGAGGVAGGGFGGGVFGAVDYRAQCALLAAQLFPDEAAHAHATGRNPVSFEALGGPDAPDLVAVYATGGVVVRSSVVDGFPAGLVEAMFCGRATVSTDVGATGEVIGGTGLLVPPRNPQALAAACLTLLRDPDRRARLGAAARARALELFTVEQNAGTFRSIYLELMSHAPVAHPEAARRRAGAPAPFAHPAEAHVPGRWTAPRPTHPAPGRPLPRWARTETERVPAAAGGPHADVLARTDGPLRTDGLAHADGTPRTGGLAQTGALGHPDGPSRADALAQAGGPARGAGAAAAPVRPPGAGDGARSEVAAAAWAGPGGRTGDGA